MQAYRDAAKIMVMQGLREMTKDGKVKNNGKKKPGYREDFKDAPI